MIAAWLREHEIDNVLLPAYLCPDIPDILAAQNLNLSYYKVSHDLTPDIASLREHINPRQALYYINYCGCIQPAAVLAELKRLQTAGHVLIEDNAMAGFPRTTLGNFVFNSIRKLAPYDGGYLRSDYDLGDLLQALPDQKGDRLPLIRAYRQALAGYQTSDEGDFDWLCAQYQAAEQAYRAEPNTAGDPTEQDSIEHLDWPRMAAIRRANYAYLLELLPMLPALTPVFPVLPPDVTPMGFPVYVDGIDRDWLQDQLGEAGIGLTAHWHEIAVDPRLNRDPQAVDMSRRMLTLTCDHRTSRKQIDYMIRTLMELTRLA